MTAISTSRVGTCELAGRCRCAKPARPALSRHVRNNYLLDRPARRLWPPQSVVAGYYWCHRKVFSDCQTRNITTLLFTVISVLWARASAAVTPLTGRGDALTTSSRDFVRAGCTKSLFQRLYSALHSQRMRPCPGSQKYQDITVQDLRNETLRTVDTHGSSLDSGSSTRSPWKTQSQLVLTHLLHNT